MELIPPTVVLSDRWTALKAGFLAALAPAPAVMPAAYDELTSRVFAQVLPLLTIQAGSTSVPT